MQGKVEALILDSSSWMRWLQQGSLNLCPSTIGGNRILISSSGAVARRLVALSSEGCEIAAQWAVWRGTLLEPYP